MLLIYHNSLSGNWLLTHVTGNLLLVELLLHVNWIHRKALGSYNLLLLTIRIESHVLMIHHSWLHVKELTVHELAWNHLHVLRILTLVKLTSRASLVLLHRPIILT